jgi:hypothetical protein
MMCAAHVHAVPARRTTRSVWLMSRAPAGPPSAREARFKGGARVEGVTSPARVAVVVAAAVEHLERVVHRHCMRFPYERSPRAAFHHTNRRTAGCDRSDRRSTAAQYQSVREELCLSNNCRGGGRRRQVFFGQHDHDLKIVVQSMNRHEII